MSIILSSSAFKNGGIIPLKYTADGKNISPALKWKGDRAGVKSYVIVCNDPDSSEGTWVHWILYNIPADISEIEENTGNVPELPGNAVHGRNSWGKVEYRGPDSPLVTHRYFFTIYAVDTEIHLKSAPEIHELQEVMKGHVISEGQLMGLYSKK